jgi:hypothetical protein
MTSVSERVRLAWVKRRELHGPSGGNHGQGITKYKPGGRAHGHRNTYAEDGCRCVWCTEAHRYYARLLTGRRKMAVAAGQGPLRHGASGYANHGCRCVNCRVAYYLKDITASAILRQHGIVREGDEFIMVARTTSPFIASRRVDLLMRGQILPDDFDDDTRIAEAVLRYHPPRAWTAC